MSAFEKPSVEVPQSRYDELLRKEALLETVKRLHGRTSDYVFRDVVGHLFNTVAELTGDVNE